MKTQNIILSLTLLFGVNFSISARELANDFTLEIDSITYLEEEEVATLDFDTAAYLPEDFNPYAAPSNFLHVSYLNEEGHIELGFDTKQYLPEGFDPHEYFFDIHSINYIEEESSDPYLDVQKFLKAHSVPAIGR